jgi:hypothetical protein
MSVGYAKSIPAGRGQVIAPAAAAQPECRARVATFRRTAKPPCAEGFEIEDDKDNWLH